MTGPEILVPLSFFVSAAAAEPLLARQRERPVVGPGQ